MTDFLNRFLYINKKKEYVSSEQLENKPGRDTTVLENVEPYIATIWYTNNITHTPC